DPLRMPEDYRTRLGDIVPTAKKQDSTQADDGKSKTTTSSAPARQTTQSTVASTDGQSRNRRRIPVFDSTSYSWRNARPAATATSQSSQPSDMPASTQAGASASTAEPA